MAKRLIYQVYTGKRSKLYDHCTASVKAYAEDINSKESPRNKVDYVIQTQPIMRIKPDVFATNRSKESYEKYVVSYQSTKKKMHLHTLMTMIK